jgi:hypothetical protein
MSQITLPTTGDRVLDTHLAYAVMDLGLRVDPDVQFEVALGWESFLRIRSELSSKELGRGIFRELKRSSKSFSIADKLNFSVNVGGRKWSVEQSTCIYCAGKRACEYNGDCGFTIIPAYAVFSYYVDESVKFASFPWSLNPISKKPKERNLYGTLYVCISPYWSKGLRNWDRGRWEEPSTYVKHPILPLAFYGMVNYAVNVMMRKPNVLFQLIFSPPLGRILSHVEAVELLSLIKRIIITTSLEMRRIFRLELPTMTLPLSLLSLLDIPAIYMLYEIMPSILFINYDIDRGAPKNPRGYEELSLAYILEFYKQLGRYFWSFRSLVNDLLNIAERKQYRSQVFNILTELALGIKNKESSYINDAIAGIWSLQKKEAKIQVHVPGAREIVAIQGALKYP